ncbi:MAG: hypothetical protein ABIB97_01660 [Patescibacteria group bacterium]
MDCKQLEIKIAGDPELKEQMDEYREKAHQIIGGSRNDINLMNLADIAERLADEYDTEGDQVADQIYKFLKVCEEQE